MRASWTSRTSSRAMPSRRSSSVSSRSSATVMPPSLATPQPSRTSWARSTSEGVSTTGPPARSTVTSSPRASDAARVPSSRASAAATSFTRGPSLGPSTLKSGLARHRPNVSADSANTIRFTLSSSATISRSGSRTRAVAGEVHHCLRQRLAHLRLGLDPDRATEAHDRARGGHACIEAVVARAVLRERVVRQMHRVGPPVSPGSEVPPELLGDERGEGGEERRHRHQARVQRVEGGDGIVPASPPGFQNRRRDRRTYQLERSSTKAWIARPAPVAS